jgi:DoxX-like family
MFYRVDYILALTAAGFLVGTLLSKKAELIPSARLAHIYYVIVATLMSLRIAAYVCTAVANPPAFVNTAGSVFGDLSIVAFGAAFGLALRRSDARTFLTDRSLVDAFFLALAFGFALAGVAKTFAVAPMTEFFNQSGYSGGFLKFIEIAEIFGGIGLLLKWARIPALLGLTIDMFGAVITHIHNGDPLNDSTGAIGMLIRLVAMAVLLGLQSRPNHVRPPLSRAVIIAISAAAVCLCIALGGAAVLRH